MATRKKRSAAKPSRAPAPAAEKKIDARLVDRTLALIAGHEAASDASRRTIGEHVLDEYFGGDEALARSTSPVKAKSFAALATRADQRHGWSADDLRSAVRAAIAYRSLAASVRDRLPAGALVRLASIEDVAARRALAAKIASKKLSGVAAREAIAAAGAKEARGGRPRLPAALREGRKILRAVLRVDEGAHFGARRVRELDDAQREELGDRLDEAIAKLRAFKAALRRE